MTGLILKDFLILRKTLRSYLLILVVYAAVAFSGFWSGSFVGSFIMVMVAMLPMNVFAYDKQCNWDVYGLALPVGRTKTVAARYACVLLLCLASAAFSAVMGVALSLMGRMEESMAEYLVTCAVVLIVGMMINSVMLPLLYKFGSERARIMFYGVLGVIVLLGVIFFGPLGGIDWLETLGTPTMEQVAAVPVIAAIASLVLLAASFLLSRHFYGSKDV